MTVDEINSLREFEWSPMWNNKRELRNWSLFDMLQLIVVKLVRRLKINTNFIAVNKF